MQEAQSEGHDSLFQEFQLEPFDYTDILDAMPTSQPSMEPQLVRIFFPVCSHATHQKKKKIRDHPCLKHLCSLHTATTTWAYNKRNS
jgi:hypothetical protein